MNKSFYLMLLSAFTGILCACSLNYDKLSDTENSHPEIVSINSTFIRTEDERQTLNLTADKIEQYKSGDVTYAQNPSFKTFDENNQIDSEGKCDLLSANSQLNQYTLIDNIIIKNYSRNLTIIAKTLHWNGDTKQLTSDKNSSLIVKRDDITLSGIGFSGSAASNTFNFDKEIKGFIDTESFNNQESESEEVIEE